jgi:hypothetical protein
MQLNSLEKTKRLYNIPKKLKNLLSVTIKLSLRDSKGKV